MGPSFQESNHSCWSNAAATNHVKISKYNKCQIWPRLQSSRSVWISAGCSGERSPALVQQHQQGYACGCGKDGAHPETQLAEVAVLYDGQDGGTAQEHHHLEEEDTSVT